MARFRAWVKKHLGSTPTPQKQPANQLPFLPTRRRSIALPSFDTTCLFFQLPFDVRELILLAAFGGCTLHMDILRQENSWQWRGAVCRRNEGRIFSWYGWVGPWNDPCLGWDYDRSGEILPENRPGIMGFLLSCRQAYAEGIDVLYSANCIHIFREPLLLHLPQLIPNNRLGSITSLEVVVAAHRIQQDNSRSSFSFDHLKLILENIETHCNHLRSFCLSLLVHSRTCQVLDSPALPLIDTFYHSMRLRNMRVELPSVSYRKTGDSRSTGSHPREAPIKRALGKSKWRSLDGEGPWVQYRSIERYPFPPLRLPLLENGDESVESAGYWLLEGDEGPLPQVVTCS